MDLVIDPRGGVRCLYAEAIDLAQLGAMQVRRAAHVEPRGLGGWLVDLRPSGGPIIGPFPYRSGALAAEAAWLSERLLGESSLAQPTGA